MAFILNFFRSRENSPTARRLSPSTVTVAGMMMCRVTPCIVMSSPILTSNCPFFSEPFTSALLKVISGYFAASRTISSNSLFIICFCCGVKTSLVSSRESARIASVSEAGLISPGVSSATPLKSRTARISLCPLNQASPPREAITVNLLRAGSTLKRRVSAEPACLSGVAAVPSLATDRIAASPNQSQQQYRLQHRYTSIEMVLKAIRWR